MSSHEQVTETIDGAATNLEDNEGHKEESSEMVTVNLLQNVQSLQ